MSKYSYYEVSSVFKETVRAMKKALSDQEALHTVGLRMSSMTLNTELLTDSALKGAKFPSNADLFMSGKKNLPSLKMKLKIDIISKS